MGSIKTVNTVVFLSAIALVIVLILGCLSTYPHYEYSEVYWQGNWWGVVRTKTTSLFYEWFGVGLVYDYGEDYVGIIDAWTQLRITKNNTIYNVKSKLSPSLFASENLSATVAWALQHLTPNGKLNTFWDD